MRVQAGPAYSTWWTEIISKNKFYAQSRWPGHQLCWQYQKATPSKLKKAKELYIMITLEGTNRTGLHINPVMAHQFCHQPSMRNIQMIMVVNKGPPLCMKKTSLQSSSSVTLPYSSCYLLSESLPGTFYPSTYTLEEHQTPPYHLPLLDKIVLSIYHHYFDSLAITLSGMDSEIKRFMLRTQSTSGLLTFRGMINPSCPILKYINTTFTQRVLLTVSIQKQTKIIPSQYLTSASPVAAWQPNLVDTTDIVFLFLLEESKGKSFEQRDKTP